MSGTKIFVLHKKELIRIGAIAIIGLALIILGLILLLGGRNTPQAPAAYRFNPGTYAATIVLNNKPIEIRVTVDQNDILAIYMTDMAELQRVFFPLFEPRLYDLAQEVLRYQTIHFTPATDYPVTTGILHEAVQAALLQAER
ncbi:MAG: hypothetical protein FWC78_09115 [Defluviitaleaceae bacterium]|nr:hypothetical protein [Defluviitaleaceae bacterium]